MKTDYEKALGATEAMTASYHASLGCYAAAEYGYIDPNQFPDEDTEGNERAIKAVDKLMAYDDAIEAAKTLATTLQAHVKVTVWDGHPHDFGTNELDEVTIFPNRKIGQ